MSEEDKLSDVLDSFCQRTSAHGLCSIPFANNRFSRLLWLSFFAAAFSGIVYQTFDILMRYYSYPMQEITEMRQIFVDFPDVTVCNIEPYDLDTKNQLLQDPASSTHEYNFVKLPRIKDLLKNSSFLDKAISSQGFYENLRNSERKEISHSLHDLVIGCSFSDLDCTMNMEDYFIFVSDSSYFNCYTFSAANMSSYYTGIGPEAGLSLILFVGESGGINDEVDTYSKVTQGGGARVIVHNRGSLPSPLSYGFDIMAGHSTSAVVHVTEVRRLSDPHANCTNGENYEGSGYYKYSTLACRLFAGQKYVVDQCNCLSVKLPVHKGIEHYPFCGFYNFSNNLFLDNVECEKRAFIAFFSPAESTQDHLCEPLCSSFTYDFSLSQSMWPRPKYRRSFFEKYISPRPHLRAHSVLANSSNGFLRSDVSLSENFARLNVFLQSPNVLSRRQMASYAGSNLLSDIGGTMGLWAGLSVITICEFGSLLISLFATCLKRVLGGQWTPSHGQQPQV